MEPEGTAAGSDAELLCPPENPKWISRTAKKTQTVETLANSSRHHQARQAGRLPPIVLTETNLIILLKQLVKGNFEFCNTIHRARIITKGMVDFSANG
jgi:hypothetical protein